MQTVADDPQFVSLLSLSLSPSSQSMIIIMAIRAMMMMLTMIILSCLELFFCVATRHEDHNLFRW